MTTQNEGGATQEPPAGDQGHTQAHPIHGMNAGDAKDYVAVQDLADLDAIEAAEKANPKNPGGRVSVLKAITERRTVLAEPQAEAAAEADEADADIELVADSGGTKSDKAIDLLLNTCEKYGVHPGTQRRPRELASWRFYPGSRVDGIPDAVVIVTSGGTKLKEFADPNYPMDPDTDEKLHMIFNAYTVDKATKLPSPAPLPADLTLPDTMVTGQATSNRHKYVGGYLRRKPTK